jgi:hypothetical protein
MMISLRNYRLASLNGSVTVFEAGTPTFVKESQVQDALAAGCGLVNENERPFFDDQAKVPAEFAGNIRQSLIYLAVKAIAEANNTKHFDSSGTPKIAEVGNRVGFDVSQRETRDVFEMYTAAKGEGRDAMLHPEAENIMRVVEAESRADLQELAFEFGYTEEQIKKVPQSRELRKLLLTKFQAGINAKPKA